MVFFYKHQPIISIINKIFLKFYSESL